MPLSTGIAASSFTTLRYPATRQAFEATLVDNDNVEWTALYRFGGKKTGIGSFQAASS